MTLRRCLFALFVGPAIFLNAAEPEVTDRDLSRVPPTEPGKAPSTFQIKKGFRLELAAAEPLVVDPIALSFDEDGRLYVVEMRDYSERRPERLGRIRRLEDTDGDGRFDTSSVYVDGLPWPTAVFCYDGGVFVGATPDILFCKDTNGDGAADVKEVVFTGFASDYAPFQTNRLNVQALMNSFNWGLDNRIHGSASMSGGKVQLVDSEFTRAWRERVGVTPRSALRAPHPVDLRGRDFSFDPRALELRAESGGAQHGMSFDSRGRKFVCSNSDHIQLVMYEDRYAGRNPYHALPPPRVSIAADGPAAEVFRISPDEPWRVIRTKWRVAGLVPGPIEGGGRPSGYFTGATGTTIYRGDAFPEEYRENAFIADCGSNLVHRKKLHADPEQPELSARRPDDEQKVEFLASTDNWFRPVQFANAPDGCLYISDMYREVIEHPWSLPAGIKQHLDLNSGNDRGRIYRIVPDGFKQRKPPRLSQATTRELVALLEHPNGWRRDTAARLLLERPDNAAVPLVEALLKKSSSAFGRLHALYSLEGLGALTLEHVRRSLDDTDEAVREHAVRLAERLTLTSTPEITRATQHKLRSKLLALANDSNSRVRYQLVFALSDIVAPEDRLVVLVRIIRRQASDRWVRAAVLNAVNDDAGEMFAVLADGREFGDSSGGREFLQQLANVIGARDRSTEVDAVIGRLARNASEPIAFSLARSLGEGLTRAGSSLARADADRKLDRVFARAKEGATDTSASEATRIEAAQLLALTTFDAAKIALASLLAPTTSEKLQSTAITSLGRFPDPGVATLLLGRWKSLTPRLRSEVVAVSLVRPERIMALLDALEGGAIARSELSAAQVQTLRTHRDAGIHERAVRLFGDRAAANRDDVVNQFLPALQLRGNPANGKRIFLERCASCHRLGDQGTALGPDLNTVKTAGKEKLLVSILDPNRDVAPNYLNYTADTKSGDTFSGLIVAESPGSVTLRGPNGAENVVARSQIKTLQSSGQSLMPEGLEAGLTAQDVADLIEYLGVAE